MSRLRTPLAQAIPAALILVAVPVLALAATAEHAVDLSPVLEGLVLVLIGARLGGAAFERIGQSRVLGELAAGVVIGNLGLVGFHGLDALRHLPAIELLAQIGVLILLFQVGLESDVGQMMAVGLSSLRVASLGVIAPIVLGFLVSLAFFPAHSTLIHWYVGGTLCATSVGITARVLSDLGRVASREGRIILGAAVMDDVMGLMVLAVVAGIIEAVDRGAAFRPLLVLWIVARSLAFLLAAVLAGRWFSKTAFGLAMRLRGDGLLLSIALAFCFALAWLARKAGLAPIVGAFAAGLVLEEVHYRELRARDPRQRALPELLDPLASFLVPVFFVAMGMRVDLAAFAQPGTLGFAAVLTLAAALSKQACALGVLEPGVDRLAVGIGMIPRGEVGLILASFGATLTLHGQPVVDSALFSAVVMMVALTTLMTPPLLMWRLQRSKARP